MNADLAAYLSDLTFQSPLQSSKVVKSYMSLDLHVINSKALHSLKLHGMGQDISLGWETPPRPTSPQQARANSIGKDTKFSASLSRQGRALPRVRPRPSCCSPVSRNDSQGGPRAQGLDSLVGTGQGRGDKSAAVMERNVEGDAENTARNRTFS